jgi:hypothetical protein
MVGPPMLLEQHGRANHDAGPAPTLLITARSGRPTRWSLITARSRELSATPLADNSKKLQVAERTHQFVPTGRNPGLLHSLITARSYRSSPAHGRPDGGDGGRSDCLGLAGQMAAPADASTASAGTVYPRAGRVYPRSRVGLEWCVVIACVPRSCYLLALIPTKTIGKLG